MSRADAILDSLRTAIEARRAELDGDGELRFLTFNLKFARGKRKPLVIETVPKWEILTEVPK